jgi:SAM-dependent methyltransferase
MNIAGILRPVVRSQQWLCGCFDHLLPRRFRIDGNRAFNSYVASHVKDGLMVCDVGGGKRPFFTVNRKEELNLRVCGIDIDIDQLRQAPLGTYDEVHTADIASYSGAGDTDLVICRAVLEHVQDTSRAVEAIASLLKPGGKALIFVPCTNAAFARINRVLPECLKRTLLFNLFPAMQSSQGFPSYYDHCTPDDFRRYAIQNGLVCEDVTCYYMSAYFSFAFPLHLLWRFASLVCLLFSREQTCETFSVVLRKPVTREDRDYSASPPPLMELRQALVARPVRPAKHSA